MENPAQIPNSVAKPAVVPTASKGASSLLPLVAILCLIFGLAIGFFGKDFVSKSQTSTSEMAGAISQSELPIPTFLLKNPMIGWRGGTEGTLKEKTQDTITLEDDKGNSVVVGLKVRQDNENSVVFFQFDKEATDSANPWRPVGLDQVEIGTYLRGDFFVDPNSPQHIYGSSFTIVEKPQ